MRKQKQQTNKNEKNKKSNQPTKQKQSLNLIFGYSVEDRNHGQWMESIGYRPHVCKSNMSTGPK